ncbi:MAG: hypothetical protein GY875_14035 [Gammaproteobacteria bacterium]|nr:hypothetical protein [Gammaproteobacteria bacterium]
MRQWFKIVGVVCAFAIVQLVTAEEVRTKKVEGFGGVIARDYDHSKEWWAPEKRPNEDSPNVIIFLLDDVGFAQVGSFGGLIKTPNIDNLAANAHQHLFAGGDL